MGRLHGWLRRCEALRGSSRIHDEIAEELQFHVDQRTAENVHAGISPEAARRDALRRFGPFLHIKEEAYDVRGAGRWDALMADIRYAIRVLQKHRGFAGIAVFTLALGVGANVAIFTLVNVVLLRPLPFHEPHRLVRVYDDLGGAGAQNVGMSVLELEDLQSRSGVFEQLDAVFPASAALSGGDRVERIEMLGTTPGYFELLGASAALGRVYGRGEWVPGFVDGAVISDGLWKRQFGGDPHVIGRRIRVDEDGYTIIGVMPAEFRHPGPTLNGDVDVWLAAGFKAAPFPTPPNRGQRLIPGVLARLKPDITLKQAQQRLDVFAAQLQQAYPSEYPSQSRWSLRIEPAQESLTGNVRPTLVLLWVAVSLMLLMVCVNIATLLLARSSGQMREFAIRRALGASRARLVRQVLTESMLISLFGATAALIVLPVARTSVLAMMPAEVARLVEVRADWRIFAFALSVSIVSGALFGLAPALCASAVDPNRDLKEGGRAGSTQSLRQNRSRAALVIVECALSVVLLVGAGLLIRSFAAVLRQEPGLEPTGLTVAQIWIPVPNDPKSNRYLSTVQRTVLVRALLHQLTALPGVQQAAIGRANDVPFLNGLRNPLPLSVLDEATNGPNACAAEFGAVSPAYFDVLETPLRKGRVFTDHDSETAQIVVVVNEAFARRCSALKDPLGRRLRLAPGINAEVVGVVADVRDEGLDVPPQPRVYTSIFQNSAFALSVFLRTRSDAALSREALNQTIHAVDPGLPVFGVRRMAELMSTSMARRRFSLFLMSIFGAVSLLLAALGIYGVMTVVVSERVQEFGIRRALGAQSCDILTLALRPALVPILTGISCGLAASMLVARLMSRILFGVSTADALTFATVPALLGSVALLACLGPARRASRVSPIAALRTY